MGIWYFEKFKKIKCDWLGPNCESEGRRSSGQLRPAGVHGKWHECGVWPVGASLRAANRRHPHSPISAASRRRHLPGHSPTRVSVLPKLAVLRLWLPHAAYSFVSHVSYLHRLRAIGNQRVSGRKVILSVRSVGTTCCKSNTVTPTFTYSCATISDSSM